MQVVRAARRLLTGVWRRDILIWVPGWIVGFTGLVLGFGRVYRDSVGYIAWARYFAGLDATLIARLDDFPISSPVVIASSRPIVPLLASPLIRIGVDAPWSLGIVSVLFSIGGILVSYRIGKMLISRSYGLACATSYFTSTSILAYGASVLTNAAGYFFVGLSVYIGLSTIGIRSSRRRAFLKD